MYTKSCTQTVTQQALPSMGSARQEYWSGSLFPSPEDLPNPWIELMSPALAGGFFTTEPPGNPRNSTSLKHLQFPSPMSYSFQSIDLLPLVKFIPRYFIYFLI